jgi:hypothetical protein
MKSRKAQRLNQKTARVVLLFGKRTPCPSSGWLEPDCHPSQLEAVNQVALGE